jgi:RpiB/LacA/LacB family sugar-phosphate isomerase
MRITIGSDHAGFELKQALIAYLRQNGHELNDAGTNSTAPVDYPDFAEKVALSLLRGESDRGILICGSGVGAAVAANKIPGIRAGQCHDTYSAHQGVEHDDNSVLVLGSRVIGVELAKEVCTTFLKATFTAEERHQRRLAKTLSIEQRYAAGAAAREKEP